MNSSSRFTHSVLKYMYIYIFKSMKIPPLVLGLRFSPYRMEPPGLVRIPTGIMYIYIIIYGVKQDT